MFGGTKLKKNVPSPLVYHERYDRQLCLSLKVSSQFNVKQAGQAREP